MKMNDVYMVLLCGYMVCYCGAAVGEICKGGAVLAKNGVEAAKRHIPCKKMRGTIDARYDLNEIKDVEFYEEELKYAMAV